VTLDGRVALITGAALSVGRGYARSLAAAGMHVVVADRFPNEGNALVEAVEEAGGSARFCYLDATDEESTRGAVSFTMNAFERLDVLVNNLTTYHTARFVPLTKMSVEQWDTTMAVCVRGVWLMAKAAVPFLARAPYPTIINSTTVAAYGVARWLDYGTARAAVIGMTKSMATELAAQRIRVNAICVGSVDVETLELGIVKDEKELVEKTDLTRQLIRRFGTEQDVAAVVQFLAGEGASYMTGQTVVIDGGKNLLG
jgi:NAD(P)-dependent dehydrogenase (short-subunit alcohol dehydrogenase family)